MMDILMGIIVTIATIMATLMAVLDGRGTTAVFVFGVGSLATVTALFKLYELAVICVVLAIIFILRWE